jgi:Tol biopolymer transport system component
MGEVYRARDTRLDRGVAIKILPPQVATDPERLRRFELEARATAALNHPNIVSIYDIGTDGAQTYVVSELLDGETLRDVLSAGPLPLRKAVDYAIQIARGLAAAHERGIVHRDVKPENVFITTDRRPKILDFGLAKVSEREAVFSSVAATALPGTEPGLVLGTVGYMSPEQVRGVAADYRSDIFSFGVVLYEMLSGVRAFAADTAAEMMTAVLKSDPPPLPALAPGLQRIVDRCLEKRPEARFQSTGDLAFALEALSPSSAAAAVPSTTTRRRIAVREVIAWAISGVLLVALSAGLLMQNRLRPADERIFRYTILLPAPLRLPTNPPIFAVSPDGRLVAFVGRNFGAAAQIWVRPLDSFDARPLAGTENGTMPFWSPDSRRLAFFVGLALHTVDVSGGPVTKVCDIPGPPAGGTWDANGRILFGSQSGAIFLVSDTGGSPTPITALDSNANERAHVWPEFLPDRRHFLFFALGSSQLRVGSLDQRDSSLIAPAESKGVYASGSLLFVRSGVLVRQRFDPASLKSLSEPIPIVERVASNQGGTASFSASTNGVLVYSKGEIGRSGQLNWYDHSGQLLGRFGSAGPYRNPRLSPDDRRVVVDRVDEAGGSEVWVLDDRGSATRVTAPPLTGQQAVWSPDGERVAFTIGAPGPSTLVEKLASGVGSERTLLNLDGSASPDDWAPDGRALLYHLGGTTAPTSLMLLPYNSAAAPPSSMGEPQKPSPVVESRFVAVDGRFSTNGKWLAYVSTESGGPEVIVQSFPTAFKRWTISVGGGIQPVWRRDGQELFYVGADGKLMAVSVKLGDATEIGSPHPLFQPQLAAFPLTIGGGTHHQYDVSRDGRFLILTTPTQTTDPSFYVILNWSASEK